MPCVQDIHPIVQTYNRITPLLCMCVQYLRAVSGVWKTQPSGSVLLTALNTSFGRNIGVTATKMVYLKSVAQEDSEYTDIMRNIPLFQNDAIFPTTFLR